MYCSQHLFSCGAFPASVMDRLRLPLRPRLTSRPWFLGFCACRSCWFLAVDCILQRVRRGCDAYVSITWHFHMPQAFAFAAVSLSTTLAKLVIATSTVGNDVTMHSCPQPALCRSPSSICKHRPASPTSPPPVVSPVTSRLNPAGSSPTPAESIKPSAQVVSTVMLARLLGRRRLKPTGLVVANHSRRHAHDPLTVTQTVC